MCYGSLDPKYLMRDIEDRVASLRVQQDGKAEPPSSPVRDALARLWRHLAIGAVRRPAAKAESLQ